MPFDEAASWVFLTMFGTGLVYLIEPSHRLAASVLVTCGLLGLGYMVLQRERPQYALPVKGVWVWLGLVFTWSFLGYTVYQTNFRPIPPMVTMIVKAPLAPVLSAPAVPLVPPKIYSGHSNLAPAKNQTAQNPEPNIPAPSPPPSVINAPNGIGISGGEVSNPTVNNFGPPPAHLSFTEEVVTPLAPGTGKSMKVHVTTDRSIPGAIIGIVFSDPVEYSKGQTPDDPTLKNASITQLSWGGPLANSSGPVPNSMGIFVNAPAAFLPSQELIVPIKSMADVHVLQVVPVGAGKP